MKCNFSSSWQSSASIRKQRKFRAHAPLHTKHKFLSAPLSSELAKKYGKRSCPLRKGDEVVVMRGSSKKKKVKISSVSLSDSRVYLEGIQATKRDGTKVPISFRPSALQIVSFGSEDKKRTSALQRNSQLKVKTSEK